MSNLENYIKKTQVEKAVKALVLHLEKSKKQDEILQENEKIYLTFTLQEMPASRKGTSLVKLKNSLLDEQDKILLIVKDSVKLENFSNVQVITIQELKKFKSFQEKRRILKEFSLFLVDDALLNVLASVLGRKFYDYKKLAIPLKISKNPTVESLLDKIQEIKNSTTLYIRGICLSVKIGSTGLGVEGNVENVLLGVEGVVKKIKGGWENVQSIHLKSKESVALPIYSMSLSSFS